MSFWTLHPGLLPSCESLLFRGLYCSFLSTFCTSFLYLLLLTFTRREMVKQESYSVTHMPI